MKNLFIMIFFVAEGAGQTHLFLERVRNLRMGNVSQSGPCETRLCKSLRRRGGGLEITKERQLHSVILPPFFSQVSKTKVLSNKKVIELVK